jgi:hypothetical protein
MKNLKNLNPTTNDFLNLILVKDSKLKGRGYVRYNSNGSSESSGTSTAYCLPSEVGEFNEIRVKFSSFKTLLSSLRYSHGTGDWRDPKFYEDENLEDIRKEKIENAISFFEAQGYSIWSKDTIEYCIDKGYSIDEMVSTLVNSGSIKFIN